MSSPLWWTGREDLPGPPGPLALPSQFLVLQWDINSPKPFSPLPDILFQFLSDLSPPNKFNIQDPGQRITFWSHFLPDNFTSCIIQDDSDYWLTSYFFFFYFFWVNLISKVVFHLFLMDKSLKFPIWNHNQGLAEEKNTFNCISLAEPQHQPPEKRKNKARNKAIFP